MNVLVQQTSTGRKLWVTIRKDFGPRAYLQTMFFRFGTAEEMIHYGLEHLKFLTPDGPGILPTELRRQDPRDILIDLFRRKMLLPDEEKLGPALRRFHAPEGDFLSYWNEVHRSGLYNLTPMGRETLQAVKAFFLADFHGRHGIVPLYSLDRKTITDEEKAKIQAACDHWGVDVKFIAGAAQGNVGLADIHVHLTPAEGTWWLRQFPRFEDRLHLFIPTTQFEGLDGPCIEDDPHPTP